MISELLVVKSPHFNPYKNFAIESALLDYVKPSQCILYLWQNQKTIVIGKNQNCFSQCNIELAEAESITIARRLSGGGAVYHDLGNLNFSFITTKDNYNTDKQLDVILFALSNLGLNAQKSGRNDITIDDKKISGNAFIITENACCHHGTVLVNVDKSSLGRYLSVSKEKLKQNGVQSVKARVANLCDFSEIISVENVKSALVSAFRSVYNQPLSEMPISLLEQSKLNDKELFFSSHEWIFNKKGNNDFSIYNRFPWGELTIHFALNKNIISACEIYTDSLNTSIFDGLKDVFVGKNLSSSTLSNEIDNLLFRYENSPLNQSIQNDKFILSDIKEFLKSLEI